MQGDAPLFFFKAYSYLKAKLTHLDRGLYARIYKFYISSVRIRIIDNGPHRRPYAGNAIPK